MTLIFATDMHHMLLAGVYESYAYFPPDAPLMLGDAADMAVRIVAQAFMVGVQMSAPFGRIELALAIIGR